MDKKITIHEQLGVISTSISNVQLDYRYRCKDFVDIRAAEVRFGPVLLGISPNLEPNLRFGSGKLLNLELNLRFRF